MKVVIGCVLFVALVPVLWLAVVFNVRHRICVRLENGANLGYEAVFDLTRPLFRPIAVPKLPDGIPLIRDGMWAIYVSNTTIYGWALGRTSDEDYWYA